MRLGDFVCPAAGENVRSYEGHDTFVPAPLPPTMAYESELALALSQAGAALSELSGIGRLTPRHDILAHPHFR